MGALRLLDIKLMIDLGLNKVASVARQGSIFYNVIKFAALPGLM